VQYISSFAITMGKVLDSISEKEAEFIANAKVFFVATAPLGAEHHVNVSPKAPGNSCVVLSPLVVAYADLTGSGAETAAHVLENGRMTLMFCNLERGPPNILRLFGRAEVILAADCDPNLLAQFPEIVTSSFGFRAVYKLQLERISTSCGYSLPQLDFVKHRHTLQEWAVKLGRDGVGEYLTHKNSFSIDGLPSLALLSTDGPKRIVPVAKDGYIFGEVVTNEVTSAPAMADAVELARRMRPTRRSVKKIELSLDHILALMVAAFGLGVLVGPALLNRVGFDMFL
jgi:hypothetical protein